MSILLATLLATAPVVTAAEIREDRALLCQGSVSVIADDDPALALYADEAAELGIEEAKARLASDRSESCAADERNVLAGASVSAIAAAVEHICLASPDGEPCDVLRRATEPTSAVTWKQRAEVAEGVICPNGMNDWDETFGPSCD